MFKLRIGIWGSNDNLTFWILKNCPSVFQSGYITLHSHEQCMRVLIYPHLHQHSLLSVFLIIVIPVVLSGISLWFGLMTNDFKHGFRCLPFVYLLSIQILCQFLNCSFPYYWVITFFIQIPYQICDYENIYPTILLVFLFSDWCLLNDKFNSFRNYKSAFLI